MKIGDLVKHKPEWLAEQYVNCFHDKKIFECGIITEIRDAKSTGRVFVRVTGCQDGLNSMWFVSKEVEVINV